MNNPPELIDDKTHAEALHVLQDIQENIRDAKRSQWNTTHYAALLYAALLATMKLFDASASMPGDNKAIFERAILSNAAWIVFAVWAGVILWLEVDLFYRRCTASRIQWRWFTEEMKRCLGGPRPCRKTMVQSIFRDAPILAALALVSVGGLVLTQFIIWH